MRKFKPLKLEALTFILIVIALFIFIALLYVDVVLAAEAIATYESSCTTSQTIFLQGEVVCAKATGLKTTSAYSINWTDPNSIERQSAYQAAGPTEMTDTFDTNLYATGTWTVDLRKWPGGALKASTTFELTGVPEFPHGLTLPLLVGFAVYVAMRKLGSRLDHASSVTVQMRAKNET